jgi:hypothetical protein
MECTTIGRYDENGSPVFKSKKKFDTLEEAIALAKKVNAYDHRIHKVIGYKCTICHKFHIGRNGKEVKEKDRDKYMNEKRYRL